jgi:hypothetical protein
MKKSDRLKKEATLTMEKIRGIARHIRNVEDNCFLLGSALIERGEIDLGKHLIANGYVHDASKFHGIEFDNMALTKDGSTAQEEGAKLKMKLAIQHHRSVNPHHPEHWSGGIKSMPRVYLAECSCDWKARSEEFGTDLRQWINEEATKRYNFTAADQVYKDIMEFVDLLCPKPFENIAQS